jgi:hypothetical protein
MKRKTSIDMGSLILSFLDSMDLASPDLTQHQQRTAYICWRIGKSKTIPFQVYFYSFFRGINSGSNPGRKILYSEIIDLLFTRFDQISQDVKTIRLKPGNSMKNNSNISIRKRWHYESGVT